jgi:acyl carrier protein
MQQSEIYSNLTDVFHEVFGDKSIVLSPETKTTDIQGWDSFNHIRLIVATEARFKIKFRTSELESLANVGRLVEVIALKAG